MRGVDAPPLPVVHALDRLAGRAGVVIGTALDHRDALSAAFARRGLAPPSPDEATRFKLEAAAVLAPRSTAVLLDPAVAPAAIAAGSLPGDVALVVPLEQQGYEQRGDDRRTTLMTGWSALKAARLGAAACKLLLPYRPDRPATAAHQEEVAALAHESCRRAGLALVLEPIVYPLEGTGDLGAGLAELVAESASRLRRTADLLKLQYPGSADDCRTVDEACGTTPWVLLGGGAAAEQVESRLREACEAGASGFVIGRTLWDCALEAAPEGRAQVLAAEAAPLLDRLAAIARERARPWRRRLPSLPVPDATWYAGDLGL